MREEMKEDAAEEGAPVRTQTVGRRTVRAAKKPGEWKKSVRLIRVRVILKVLRAYLCERDRRRSSR